MSVCNHTNAQRRYGAFSATAYSKFHFHRVSGQEEEEFACCKVWMFHSEERGGVVFAIAGGEEESIFFSPHMITADMERVSQMSDKYLNNNE